MLLTYQFYHKKLSGISKTYSDYFKCYSVVNRFNVHNDVNLPSFVNELKKYSNDTSWKQVGSTFWCHAFNSLLPKIE